MSEDQEKKKQEDGGENKSEESQKDLDSILDSLKESENAAQEEKKTTPSQELPEVAKSESTEEEPEGIEKILDSIKERSDQEAVEDVNVLQRIVGIFTGPVKVFNYLKVKPDFIVPLILAILIAMASGFFFYDIAINDQIAKVEKNERFTDEQRNQFIDRIEQSRTGLMRILSPFVFGPIMILILYAFLSLIFWAIGNVLLGGKTKYKKIFSIFSYSYLIIILLESIVQYPLIFSKQTLNIDMSPGILIDTAGMSDTLANFIGAFDIFHIWFLVVFGVGFSIIYGFSKLKGVVSVFIAWLLYVVVFKVVLASLTLGLFG